MSAEPTTYPAERTKAFADAVVAIAMTLLILPLMESVGEAGREGGDAAEWLAQQTGPLFVFVLSFVLIAMFWLIHHRLFSRVERVTSLLQWLIVAWLLTIVWLPVATAMTGQFDGDALQESLYIGSMILPCLMALVIRLYLRRHPSLGDLTPADLREGMAVDLAMTTLFAAALALAVLVPSVSYWALLLLMLVAPLQRVWSRMLRAGAIRR